MKRKRKMTTDNFGVITIEFDLPMLDDDGNQMLDDDGNPRVEIFRKSPPHNVYTEAENLMHVINQKSTSGQDLLSEAIAFIKTVRSTREDLPDNTRLIIETTTAKQNRNFYANLNDYESFVVVAKNIRYEVEKLDDEKEVQTEITKNTDWLLDDDDDESENPGS